MLSYDCDDSYEQAALQSLWVRKLFLLPLHPPKMNWWHVWSFESKYQRGKYASQGPRSFLRLQSGLRLTFWLASDPLKRTIAATSKIQRSFMMNFKLFFTVVWFEANWTCFENFVSFILTWRFKLLTKCIHWTYTASFIVFKFIEQFISLSRSAYLLWRNVT